MEFLQDKTSHKVFLVSEPTQNGDLLGLSILLVQPLNEDANRVCSQGAAPFLYAAPELSV